MVRSSKYHLRINFLYGADSLFKFKVWILTQLYSSVPVEIDEYDLVDPVDILTPLEKSGFWDGVVCDPSWMNYPLVAPSYEK